MVNYQYVLSSPSPVIWQLTSRWTCAGNALSLWIYIYRPIKEGNFQHGSWIYILRVYIVGMATVNYGGIKGTWEIFYLTCVTWEIFYLLRAHVLVSLV